MRKVFRAGFLAIVCIICMSVQTQAQVQTYTDMWPWTWDGHNEMVGVAYVVMDYGANEEYCVDIDNYFYRMVDGAPADERYARGSGCNSFTEAAALFPLVEGSDYAIEAEFTVNVVYTYDDCYYCGFDPYGYAYYNDLYIDGEPVVVPWWFSFAGTGYPTRASAPYFFLGIVFTYLQAGSTERSGPPHHLHVHTDRTVVEPAILGCAFTRAHKFIDFQVVDSNNKHAGRVPMREEPPDPPIVDSCSGQLTSLTRCGTAAIDPFGNFTDSLKTGCPNDNTSPNCGMAFGNRWQWCAGGDWPGYSRYENIAWMFYDVRRAVIKVDNEEDITDGTNKY